MFQKKKLDQEVVMFWDELYHGGEEEKANKQKRLREESMMLAFGLEEDVKPKHIDQEFINLRVRLQRILYRLHKLDPDTTEVPEKLSVTELWNISKIKNNPEKSVRMDSDVFRIRFLTEFIFCLNQNMEELAGGLRGLGPVNLFKENQDLIDSIHRLSIQFQIAIIEFSRKQMYGLPDVLFLFGLLQHRKDTKREKLETTYHKYTDGVKYGLDPKNQIPEGQIILNIGKIAFDLIIGKDKANLIRVRSMVGLTHKNKIMIKELLTKIGEELIEYEESWNLMFLMFIHSKPQIKTTLPTKDDRALTLGIYAVVFYGWVSGDKSIQKMIEKCLI